MKNLLIFTLLLCASVRAAEITIAWDNNPVEDQVTQYRVWSWKSGVASLIGQTATNQITLILHGAQSISATAMNAGGESLHSTNLVFVAKPDKPKNLNHQQ